MDLHLLVKVLQETVAAQSKMIVALKEGMALQQESNAIQAKLIDAQNNQIKNLEAEKRFAQCRIGAW